ncbi:MAG: magnesium transporter [Candidatus Aenigmarchaeota archaeon]|nr:magnesium transporter [Candidatus Aenigmarchaeota archaeon]
MKLFEEILRQSMPVLFLCIFGEILAGLFLTNIQEYLNVLPGIIILVPAVMGTRGNILGTVSTRLTSGLHIGTIYPRFRKNPVLSTNIKAGFLMSIIISFITGVVAHFACVSLGFQSMGIVKFSLISLMAGFMADASLILLSVFICFFSFKKNIDPDNIIIPTITTISDFMSVLFLLISVHIVQAI